MNDKARYEMGFGPHLTLDMWGCSRDKIFDLRFIYSILNEVPELIGMHKISHPQVFFQEPRKDGGFDKGGVSGFVLIAESHISVHTFPDNSGHAFVDIFSCKPFAADEAVEYFVKKFEAAKFAKKMFDRGKEFPKDVILAKEIVIEERKDI